METQTLAVTAQPQSAAVAIGNRGLVLGDLESLWRFSGYVAASGLAPKGLQTREAIFVAIQLGLEVGMTPMASLQNIAPINGRPSIWGDAQLGIVRSTGELEAFEEWFEQGGKRLPRNPTTFTDDTLAVCRVKRRGYPAAETGFSVQDAKTANLWGKEGPWKQYPFRMLKARARSFALRDQFGDALRGMMSAEEAGDIRPAIEVEARPIFQAPVAEIAPTPDPAPAAEPAPAETETLQQRLAKVVTESGASWDKFAEWAKGPGFVDASMTEFSHVPDATCERLLKKPAALVKVLTA
jgi:hypothetical protein